MAMATSELINLVLIHVTRPSLMSSGLLRTSKLVELDSDKSKSVRVELAVRDLDADP